MNIKIKILLFLSISISIYACSKKEDKETLVSGGEIGPVLHVEPYDYSEYAQIFAGSLHLSDDKITLGRVLFYDKSLSFNNNISCGSCHFQDKGFADNVRFHKGVLGNVLKRNTLSITGNNFVLFWDGRASSMTNLVLKPVANHDEMMQDPNALVNKLKQKKYYKDLFYKAYGSEEIKLEGIEEALAAFSVCIVPKNTRLDEGTASVNFPFGFVLLDSLIQLNNFSAIENKGLSLFYGKARCGSCHRPEIISGYYGTKPFANIGLDLNYDDNGLGAISNDSKQNGKFKIPNLRNVALTAPYMHDGRFNSLEEVVEHYNSRIKPNSNLSPRLYQKPLSDLEIFMLEEQNQQVNAIEPAPLKLGLNSSEKAALVAFLKTLTDEKLKKDVRFSNPFGI